MVPPVARSIVRMSSKQRLLDMCRSPPKQSLVSSYSTSQNTASKGSQSRKDAFSQGNVTDSANLHKRDTQSQAVEAGQEARGKKSGGPLDAASNENVKQDSAKESTKGNPEGVGMKDQVGSATGSEAAFERK
ncbi:hypothetical protein CPB83DRAFT_835435 [Crepidotus variabilis]|uniref:Uncharacterized protein n=1 Tax=Crepidotus variabilis TaxID=179855 RepID=A0A9P6EH32_9AGAR|nr:hypothetical protein CPB83DRAFT_835435 [Crepidotus variabilis]